MTTMLTRVRKALVRRERAALSAIEEVRMSGGRSLPALLDASRHTLAVWGLRTVERILDATDDPEVRMPNQIYEPLARLVRRGDVDRVSRGVYQ